MATYELLDKLGEGGMGTVHRANQLPLNRRVAVKLLKTDADLGLEGVKRFHREIETLIRLSHPHIVKVFDAGEMEGRLFLAMEDLSDARTLHAVIRDEGPLPLARALALTQQVLEALEFIHGCGLVHRDIKPANIMVRKHDHAVVMDFGLVWNPARTRLSVTGTALGTPHYMSPETIQGGAQGPHIDIWAAGAMFYEMVLRRPPFKGVTVTELLTSIVKDEPPPPSALRADLPPALDHVVARFFKKDRAARVSSAREAIKLLASLAHAPEARLTAAGRAVGSQPAALPGRSPLAAVRGLAVATAAVGLALLGLRAGPGKPHRVTAMASSCGASAPAPGSAATDPPRIAATPAVVLAATLRALRASSPANEVRRMAREFESAFRDERAAAALVPRWERNLAAMRLRSRLEATCADHAAVQDRLDASAGVDTASLLELYELARDLEDLEQVATANRVKVPALSGLLISSRHAPATGPGFPGDRGVAYLSPGRMQPGEPEQRVAAAPECRIIRPDFPQPFQIYSDPTDDRAGSVAELGSGYHVTRDPVIAPASTPARVELRAVVQNLSAHSGFRVLISRDPDAPRSRWRLLALLRAPGQTARQVWHTLPASVFSEGPWYLRVELAFDHAWYRRAPRSREFRGYLRMLQLAWQASGGRRGLGATPSPASLPVPAAPAPPIPGSGSPSPPRLGAPAGPHRGR